MLDDLPEELINEIVDYLPYEYQFIIRTKLSDEHQRMIRKKLFYEVEWKTLDPQLQYDEKLAIELWCSNYFFQDFEVFHYIFRSPNQIDIEHEMKRYKTRMYGDILEMAIQYNRYETYKWVVSQMKYCSNRMLLLMMQTSHPVLVDYVTKYKIDILYQT
jgi:hypothetical protein